MYKTMLELEQGRSYACRFRATAMLDNKGEPAGIGSDDLVGPGDYEGLGVIKIRDTEQKLVELEDTTTGRTFVVPFDDCWDIDDVEWTDPLVQE